jgi:ferritin-like protein
MHRGDSWHAACIALSNPTWVQGAGMSSESYHEQFDLLSDETKNLHRAIVSLKEELDAVDWYQQRAEACSDDELRAVLLHNKNEEIEHAMMTLEWLRRKDPIVATNIDIYVGSSGPITEVEQRLEAKVGQAQDERRQAGALVIGSLKGAT